MPGAVCQVSEWIVSCQESAVRGRTVKDCLKWRGSYIRPWCQTWESRIRDVEKTKLNSLKLCFCCFNFNILKQLRLKPTCSVCECTHIHPHPIKWTAIFSTQMNTHPFSHTLTHQGQVASQCHPSEMHTHTSTHTNGTAIRSNLGFSFLPKDISTCRLGDSGIKPPTLW